MACFNFRPLKSLKNQHKSFFDQKMFIICLAAASEHLERRDWWYGGLTLFFVYLPGLDVVFRFFL